MSRTFRKPSQNKWMGLSKFKKVKDGTRTKPSHYCENNGGCPYCENNRLHKHNKQVTLNQEVILSEAEYGYLISEI